MQTILGVSNVSFGVKPHSRAALNSVFLYHAVQAGLDAAIVNPAHITPYSEIPENERTLCDDLLFNRDVDALPRFIAYYEQHGGERPQEEKVDPTEGMTVDERIHYQIRTAAKRASRRWSIPPSPHAPRRIAQWMTPLIARRRIPTTRTGRRLRRCPGGRGCAEWRAAARDERCRRPIRRGRADFAFVLQSAEVMKKAVARLERYLERAEGYTKGRVVLATVFGDVHDIGKNLVNTILSNNGYTVYDLGKQVPLNTIIDKAIEVNADVIGLSALLVSTSKQMPLCVAELDRRNLPIPVMVGGAAINRAYGQRILYVGEPGQEQPFGPGVFYARDAFEGLDIVEALTDSEKHPAIVERIKREAEVARERQAQRDAARAAAPAVVAEAAVQVAPAPVIVAPFWGPRVLDRVAVEDVARHLDFNALYRGRWGGVAHGDEHKRLVKEEFEPRLERLLREARQRQYLRPRAVYGYYPARAEGDTLLVLDPADPERVVERFAFPRQPDGQRLCLADYFATESGEPTAVAFQVVTMGSRASQETERMQAAGDYSEAYFLHGLSVQMAEAMADYVNARICDELRLTGEAGRRYSWGYAAIPELADHERVFRLLGVPEAIEVTLTESYQLVPEQSTAAIIVPHPGSVYFAVREAASANAG